MAAGVLAGLVWVLRHPDAGVFKPDDIHHDDVLTIARPYPGEMVGAYGSWTPLQDRSGLYSEDINPDDPWQFKNIHLTQAPRRHRQCPIAALMRMPALPFGTLHDRLRGLP